MSPSSPSKPNQIGDREGAIRRRGTMPLMIMLAISISVVGNSYLYHDSKKDKHDDQQKAFNLAKNRASESKQAETIIANYLSEFYRYQKAGIIGRENRISWIQAARDSADQLGITSMSYSVGQQEPFVPDYLFQEGSYVLNISKMDLSWLLLHENDFVSVLDSIRDNGKGVYHVRECELRRMTSVITLDPEATNIATECQLNWLSVDISQIQVESPT